MNENTFDIKQWDNLTKEEKKSHKWVKIPDDQLESLETGNREQRRKWMQEQKRILKKKK